MNDEANEKLRLTEVTHVGHGRGKREVCLHLKCLPHA